VEVLCYEEIDMPYSTITQLPPSVQKLPKHAQEIYKSAFNASYDSAKDEPRAHAIAWAAVKRDYHKVGDRWVAKEAVHPHGAHTCVCPKCGAITEVAANVKCNTQDCPECGTRMRAEEIGERRDSKEANMDVMSDQEKRGILQAALVTEYQVQQSSPIPGTITVEDVWESEIIYSVDGQTYQATYEISEDGPIFGEPRKVARQTVYKPMEALQTAYADLIQEAGKRNASSDASRVKKIMELCQELLSSEDVDVSKVKKAVTETTSVLAWLREQAATKTEEGKSYPAEAYAYVADAHKPSTWKLRLWESPDQNVTKAQLGRAAAALSPGGFRGQKVIIPVSEVAVVKRKVRTEYRKLNVDEDDIPRWVKETETREVIQNYIPLTEAKIDKGRATVTVIRPGFNATKDRYYPAEVLQRDYGIFEGQKMYADHPTEEEDKARPERSIKDWVATLSEVTCDEQGVVTGVAEIIEPWLMTKLASLRQKGMLSDMGISINAVGSASKSTIDGTETLVIEKLVAARSVDFVTEPGAGGIVTFYESDRHDIDLVEIGTLRERRPDLVKALEAAVRAEIKQEVLHKMELETQVKELQDQVGTLTTANDELRAKIVEAEKAQAKAEAQATIKEAVAGAELPEAAKAKLLERFTDAETAEGIEEAIQSERDYIAQLAESGKVKNLGGTAPNPDKDREALKESFKGMGLTDEQAETAARGR